MNFLQKLFPSRPPIPSGVSKTLVPRSGGAPPVPMRIGRTASPIDFTAANPSAQTASSIGIGGIDPRRYEAVMPQSIASINPSGGEVFNHKVGAPKPIGVKGIQIHGRAGPAVGAYPHISTPSPSINYPKNATPGQFSMPTRPSWERGASNKPKTTTTMKPNSAFSFRNAAMAAGGLMAIGGVTSYATGGNAGQGAAAGLVGGGMMYGGMRSAARLGQNGVRGFSPKIANFMSGSENKMARRAMVGSGAALGGMMFGGNRSHRRGFNSQRGNAIGR